MTGRLWSLVALVLAAGCVTEKNCRDGTVLLSFSFAEDAAQADALEVWAGYEDGHLGQLPDVPHHPGDVRGTLELDVPGFASHAQLVVMVAPHFNDGRPGIAVTRTIPLAGQGCVVFPFSISGAGVVESDAGPVGGGDAARDSADAGDAARDSADAGGDGQAGGGDGSPEGPVVCAPACPMGRTCNGGRCESVCSGAQVLCPSGCADLTSDPRNCGHCDTACKTSEHCSRGMCAATCAPGEMNCGQSCVNPASDLLNCGACGMKCTGAESCASGSCTCVAPNRVCSGGCTNVVNNRTDCGSCGNRCSGDLVCNGSACGCPSTRQQCPNNALKCVTSLDDCCPTGQGWCTDRCASLGTDSNNCGTCGHACPGAQRCNGGSCGCPVSQPHSCPGGICLPTGMCCSTETKCADGSCLPSGACCSGLSSCNGLCVNEKTDGSNCGGCGQVCGGGSVCSGGRCLQVDAAVTD